MFCTNCGKEINDGSEFCRYCGQVFENKKNKTIDYQSQMTGYAAGTTTQHVSNSKSRKPLYICLGIVAIVALLIGGGIFLSGDYSELEYELIEY